MRHPKETKEAAKKRFGELASARTVSWELKIPYDTVYAWWRTFNNRPITRKTRGESQMTVCEQPRAGNETSGEGS